jgi:hypothetical protein
VIELSLIRTPAQSLRYPFIDTLRKAISRMGRKTTGDMGLMRTKALLGAIGRVQTNQ